MSVVLDRPVVPEQQTATELPVALRQRVPVEPVRRPVVDVPVVAPNRSRVRQDVGLKIARVVCAKVALFGAVYALTYTVSTLTGQYFVEQSRAQIKDAVSRSKAAIQNERAIERRLNVIRNAATIEEWALSHGFRPADGLGETSKVTDSVAPHK